MKGLSQGSQPISERIFAYIRNQYQKESLPISEKKKTERLMDTSEGEALHFIEVYGQRLMIVTLGTAGIGK